MPLDPYTWKLIHQVSALEPDYYKLQIRDSMDCGHDEVLDDAPL